MDAYEFDVDEKPTAGSEFHFTIPSGLGSIGVNIYINEKVVDKRRCLEPPCYEAIYLSPSSAGSYLRIEGEAEQANLAYEQQIMQSTETESENWANHEKEDKGGLTEA